MKELDMRRLRRPLPWEVVDRARQVAVEQHVAEDLDLFELRMGLRSPMPDDFDKPRYSARLRNQVHEYFKIGERPPTPLAEAANAVNKLVPPESVSHDRASDASMCTSAAGGVHPFLSNPGRDPPPGSPGPLPAFMSSQPRRVASASPTPGARPRHNGGGPLHQHFAGSPYSTPQPKTRPMTAEPSVGRGGAGHHHGAHARAAATGTFSPGAWYSVSPTPGSRASYGGMMGAGSPTPGSRAASAAPQRRGSGLASVGPMTKLESVYEPRNRPSTAPPTPVADRPFLRHVHKKATFGLLPPESPVFEQHEREFEQEAAARRDAEKRAEREATSERIRSQRAVGRERRSMGEEARAMAGDPVARRRLASAGGGGSVVPGGGRPPRPSSRGLGHRGFVADAKKGCWGVQSVTNTRRSIEDRSRMIWSRETAEDMRAVSALP